MKPAASPATPASSPPSSAPSPSPSTSAGRADCSPRRNGWPKASNTPPAPPPAANAPTPGASSTTDDPGPKAAAPTWRTRPALRAAPPLDPRHRLQPRDHARRQRPVQPADVMGVADPCIVVSAGGRQHRRWDDSGMTLRLGRHSFSDERRLMMAIVNRTPDSFYDKGATWSEDKALERVAQVVERGCRDRRHRRHQGGAGRGDRRRRGDAAHGSLRRAGARCPPSGGGQRRHLAGAGRRERSARRGRT